MFDKLLNIRPPMPIQLYFELGLQVRYFPETEVPLAKPSRFSPFPIQSGRPSHIKSTINNTRALGTKK
jgi:hypothetical protein